MLLEDRNIPISYDNESEGQRFAQVYPNSKSAEWAFNLGVEKAEKFTVPSILEGAYGSTEASIEAGIAHCTQTAGVKSTFKANGFGADEAFCYRIGYRSRSRMAKQEFLSQVGALQKANDAIELIAAGMKLATEAFDLSGMQRSSLPARSDVASALGLSGPSYPCPFVRAMEHAKQQGQIAGRALALQAVERIRLWPGLRDALVDALRAGMEEALREGRLLGASSSEIAWYRRGYFEGADPIVTEALKEWAAEAGETLPDDALTRPKPALLAPQGSIRSLRPEDFGPLPTGLARH